MLPAHCPRCGVVQESIFELKPDASRSVVSIACADCLAQARAVFAPDLMLVRCDRCGGPTYAAWRFCVACGVKREVADA